MIPKIIHYCWYGNGKKDALSERCIASWKKYCPDYQIMEWNEDNCDIDGNVWTKEAYENRKWAFVSDYFRLKAMYEYGGIYMDTDVELFKNLDSFLANDAFVGYADDTYIGSGMFGCEKENAFCRILLDYYQGRHFVKEDGTLYDVPNNQIYTILCLKKMGFHYGDNRIYCGNVTVYPSDYFSPFKRLTIGNPQKLYTYSNFDCTENTYAIHYTVYSWNKNQRNLIRNIRLLLNQTLRTVMPRKLYFGLKKKSKISEMERRVEL